MEARGTGVIYWKQAGQRDILEARRTEVYTEGKRDRETYWRQEGHWNILEARGTVGNWRWEDSGKH